MSLRESSLRVSIGPLHDADPLSNSYLVPLGYSSPNNIQPKTYYNIEACIPSNTLPVGISFRSCTSNFESIFQNSFIQLWIRLNFRILHSSIFHSWLLLVVTYSRALPNSCLQFHFPASASFRHSLSPKVFTSFLRFSRPSKSSIPLIFLLATFACADTIFCGFFALS